MSYDFALSITQVTLNSLPPASLAVGRQFNAHTLPIGSSPTSPPICFQRAEQLGEKMWQAVIGWLGLETMT